MAGALPPPIAVVQRRVVVTGLGAVTPLANGMQASWERLLEGKCGIRQLRPSSPDSPRKVREVTAAAAGRSVSTAAVCVLCDIDSARSGAITGEVLRAPQ